jgi:hypothetical protein
MAMLNNQMVIYLDGDLYGVTRIMGRPKVGIWRNHLFGDFTMMVRESSPKGLISAIWRLVNHQKMTPIFSLVSFHDSGLFY